MVHLLQKSLFILLDIYEINIFNKNCDFAMIFSFNSILKLMKYTHISIYLINIIENK